MVIPAEQEKLDYLSRNFMLLNQEGKEYIEDVSRQLLYIQCPVMRPSPVQKRLKPKNPGKREG